MTIKNILKIQLTLSLCAFLSACSAIDFAGTQDHTNRTVDIKNEIHNGVIVSKIGTNPNLKQFSIYVPQSAYPRIYKYLLTEKVIGADWSRLSFGPAKAQITKLQFSNKHDISNPIFKVQVAASTIPWQSAIQHQKPATAVHRTTEINYDENQYRGSKIIYENKKLTINGHKAHYIVAVHKYHAPLPEDTDTFAFLWVDYGNYIVSFYAQADDGHSSPFAINDNNRAQLIKMTWKPFAKFVNSFKLI